MRKLIFLCILLLAILALLLFTIGPFFKNDSAEAFKIEKILDDSAVSFLKNNKNNHKKRGVPEGCDFYDLFGRIFYINLDKRADRKDALLLNLRNYAFPETLIARFPAIYDKEGARGCIKSHYFLCRDYISDKNNKYIMILEDDFVFNRNLEDIKVSFCNFLKKVPDWDVFLLCCNTVTLKSEEVIDDIYRVRGSQTTAGYILNSHYVKRYCDFLGVAISVLDKYDVFVKQMNVDLFWQYLQKIDNWYTILPLLGVQAPGYSDIQKSHVDYKNFFK